MCPEACCIVIDQLIQLPATRNTAHHSSKTLFNSWVGHDKLPSSPCHAAGLLASRGWHLGRANSMLLLPLLLLLLPPILTVLLLPLLLLLLPPQPLLLALRAV